MSDAERLSRLVEIVVLLSERVDEQDREIARACG
jgi:hypothetical protein